TVCATRRKCGQRRIAPTPRARRRSNAGARAKYPLLLVLVLVLDFSGDFEDEDENEEEDESEPRVFHTGSKARAPEMSAAGPSTCFAVSAKNSFGRTPRRELRIRTMMKPAGIRNASEPGTHMMPPAAAWSVSAEMFQRRGANS